MKRFVCLGVAGLVAGSLLGAARDAKDDVKNAAKKLEEQANYSWTSTPKSEGGGERRGSAGPTEGKTEKEGFTVLAIKFGETTGEVVLKGGKAAVKSPDGWKTPEELRGAGADRRNPLANIGRMVQNYKTPAAQAADLADKSKDLKDEGDGVSSGELTEDGVKSFLSFGRPGGQAPSISDMKGTVKFWLKEGALVKYEYNVQGKIAAGNREFNVNRTTTVEIKDAGSTKVEVPEEAKKKLE